MATRSPTLRQQLTSNGDQVDPSTVGDDLDESVVVNGLINAEIGVAKQIAGSPQLLPNGNFEVNYGLIAVENTG